MKYKIPKEIFGVPIKGAMERVVSNQNTKPNNPPNNPNVSIKNEYIYVPSINLYVAKEKTLFNYNWENTHPELSKNNLKMYTPSEAKAFLDHLFTNKSSGTPDASSSEIEKILNEILAKRDPWRSEHIDAYFEQKGEKWNILTKNKTHSEELDNCIREDCYVELGSFNKQGMPTRKSKVQKYKQGENIYFLHPRDGTVAGFDADSDWANFYCYRYPSYSNASLGVRPSFAKN